MASQNFGKLDLIIERARLVNSVDKLGRDLRTVLEFAGYGNALVILSELGGEIARLKLLEEKLVDSAKQLEIQTFFAEEAARERQDEIPLGYVGAGRQEFLRR